MKLGNLIKIERTSRNEFLGLLNTMNPGIKVLFLCEYIHNEREYNILKIISDDEPNISESVLNKNLWFKTFNSCKTLIYIHEHYGSK